jgi:N4-gp56 family major capsid protein
VSKTIVGLNDPKAIKKYSAALAVDIGRTSYFNKKMMGYGPDASAPVHMLTDLESDAGEQIVYDLNMQLAMQPVEGDNTLEGLEEDLKFYTDNVYVDQMRGGVNGGGRMTRKRTLHDIRTISKKRQADWWARVFDELFFMYLSGARGVNSDFVFGLSYPGFANNPLVAPDTNHLKSYNAAGAPVAKAALVAADKMSLSVIDRLLASAYMMGGGVTQIPQIQPIKIDGEDHYCMLINPWQEFDIRTNSTAGQWLDIQKAAAAAEGRKNPIFNGALGMYNNVVLQSHKALIQFTDYGAGGNVSAVRGLFLGSQAAVCAFGSPGSGLRFDWHEETRDNGNEIVISTNTIFGIKKCTFTTSAGANDFGVIAVDTAAVAP